MIIMMRSTNDEVKPNTKCSDCITAARNERGNYDNITIARTMITGDEVDDDMDRMHTTVSHMIENS